MKQQRIIHILEDGRQKYVSHHGKIEKWEWQEVELMRHNMQCYGGGAYTQDLSHYDITLDGLQQRFPGVTHVCVVESIAEDHDLPLRKGVII